MPAPGGTPKLGYSGLVRGAASFPPVLQNVVSSGSDIEKRSDVYWARGVSEFNVNSQ